MNLIKPYTKIKEYLEKSKVDLVKKDKKIINIKKTFTNP